MSSLPVVAVFGSSRTEKGSEEWKSGVRLGKLLVESGFGVATGGYQGSMEAVSEGAANGHVIGVTAPTLFPKRTGANQYVVEERRANSLVERIHEITDLSAASIALPGSIGTFTELIVAFNIAAVCPYHDSKPKPVIAVGPVWKQLIPQVCEAVSCDSSFVTCVDTVEEAMQCLKSKLNS